MLHTKNFTNESGSITPYPLVITALAGGEVPEQNAGKKMELNGCFQLAMFDYRKVKTHENLEIRLTMLDRVSALDDLSPWSKNIRVYIYILDTIHTNVCLCMYIYEQGPPHPPPSQMVPPPVAGEGGFSQQPSRLLLEEWFLGRQCGSRQRSKDGP